jgi:hypothetical protein
MTIDERFERIEHVTASLLEERQRDREEQRQLWRDTQRQIAEAFRAIGETNRLVTETGLQIRQTSDSLADFIAANDRRFHEFDERLGKLVSAIGALCQKTETKREGQ